MNNTTYSKIVEDLRLATIVLPMVLELTQDEKALLNAKFPSEGENVLDDEIVALDLEIPVSQVASRLVELHTRILDSEIGLAWRQAEEDMQGRTFENVA